MTEQTFNPLDIAVVGMAGRFPDADNVDALWHNVRSGHCAINTLTDDELAAAGVSEAQREHADYVKAAIPFANKDQFDAEFFGYTPKEATQLDPQQRLFLQTCWHALEQAGLMEAGQFTGVFAGCGVPAYLLKHLLPQQQDNDITSLLALTNGNEKDALATRISYELDLTGPAVTVQTACSTSLVAVHMACRALQNYECDSALAGGVWLNLLDDQGYLAPAGGSLSTSGKLSAFGEHADGILIGSGSAAVVLKRVEEAIEDGDHILAVIKGSAVNNDGRDKVGYTAPSVTGQAGAIRAALEFADVDPRSIGYIETHGTGTKLGDPIEVAALSQAYQHTEKQYCALGSIKANIGHLDSAAGVTGLIKAIQALRHKEIPPSIHSTPLNSKIDFEASPFYLPQQVQTWHSDVPRRAAVSSLGMGGTNAHVIVEEYQAPEGEGTSDTAPWHILPISAANPDSIKKQCQQLAKVIEQHPQQLSLVAAQLQHKKRRLSACHAIAVKDATHALEILSREQIDCTTTKAEPVGLLFSGQGSQYVTMAQPLYQNITAFKTHFDDVMARVPSQLQSELQAVFFPSDEQILAANQLLNQTRVTQPALFIVAYAMAKCYQAHGVQIHAMLGHSIGEYVAACLAGVMSVDDAITLVIARGEALQQMSEGAMLSVMASAQQVQTYLHSELDIAAQNSPQNTVVAGTKAAIKALQSTLKEQQISCTRLHVSHAFHSHLTEPVLATFAEALAKVELHAPTLPFVSNVTGEWITATQATSTQYWLDHIRKPVKFAQGVQTLAQSCPVLIEAGPGDTLQKLSMQNLGEQVLALHSIAHVRDLKAAIPPFINTLAALWQRGHEISWQQVTDYPRGQMMITPEYVFADTRFWQEAQPLQAQVVGSQDTPPELLTPIWQQTPLLPSASKVPSAEQWLVICDDSPLCGVLVNALQAQQVAVLQLWHSRDFEQQQAQVYRGDTQQAETLEVITAQSGSIDRVLDLRLLGDDVLAFSSHLALFQWAVANKTAVSLVTTGLFSVLGHEAISPQKATLLGATRALRHEASELAIQVLDVDEAIANAANNRLNSTLLQHLLYDQSVEVAIRGKNAFSLSQQTLAEVTAVPARTEQAVTFITGGLGGVALVLAEQLAQQGHKLALLSRRAIPDPTQWQRLAANADTEDERALFTQLCALQTTAADLMVLQGDVTDLTELSDAVYKAETNLGSITHVVHAAGVAGGGVLPQLTAEQVTMTLAAKVSGVDNLLTVFAQHSLAKMILCSSLASVLGAFAQSDYCAANAYLDAVTYRALPFPVCTINWDGWDNIGMAAGQQVASGLGLSREQGAALFKQALTSDVPHIYAAAMSWAQREIKLQALLETLSRVDSAQPLTSQGKARPSLDVEFEAPESELEQRLANLWCESLGYTEVGIFDNFFALGGDSLIAIQMIAKAKQIFAVEITPAAFFEDPTIDNLAFLVEEALVAELENQ
ncbi:SDR family NAD(P)-dependent oxidoreductase [Pseudoalteromonas sp. J010]|uniref:type I polyketide synthase n=1 Tax=Pseudoalteromonas sp. J010 TaxID=998465 RepID=UPI000F64619B|nr:type I polyketide synthase [Pseudoalteromonas sp. J010]RRS09702.1 SDR family NAD(P)-dependent oxidoreductase [Pseudoalteromonas sp. J010]